MASAGSPDRSSAPASSAAASFAPEALSAVIENPSISRIGRLPYAAAKGGVSAMTLVAARDLSPVGIRVASVTPGTVLTPAYGKAGDRLEARWGPQAPHPRRTGRPEEYAALVQPLGENDCLNGEVVCLAGALRLPPK
ncbi:SDR family oxidoreductase [Streptomyces sp. NPDC050263]|uniref:SDR family oxidoreductase n=1 Tax=Streptomyces sp. NPDC050263 TaxID=3155037 RepID=UPI003415D9AB